MNINFLVVIASALIAVFGTIYTARMSLRNNQNSLAQSLDIRIREIAEENKQEAEDARQDERGSNLAEAQRLREELKADRDRISSLLVASEKRASENEEFSRLERSEFRIEISVLQGKQREIDVERATHKVLVDTLKKQHCIEIAKYKRQLSTLTAVVSKMEARIKELEAGKPSL